MNTLNTVEDLLHLSPIEFQEMLMILYRLQGCKAYPERISGRHHLYIAITTKDNEKSLAECRIGLQVVDKDAVRSFFSLMKNENATQGAIITIGEVSDQARREVKNKPIYLYDGNEFLSLWKNSNISYPIPAGTQLIEGDDSQKQPSVGNEIVYREANVPDQGASISPDQEDISTEIAEFSPGKKQAPSFVQPESEFQEYLSPGHTRAAIHRLFGSEPLISSPAETVEPPAEEAVIDQTIPDGSEPTAKDTEASELFTNEKQAPLIDQPETESETGLESAHIQTGVDFLAVFEELKNAPPENEVGTQPETAVLDQIASTLPEQMGMLEGGEIPSAEERASFIDQPGTEADTGLEAAHLQTGADILTGTEELKNAPLEEVGVQPETAVPGQMVSTMPKQMVLPEVGGITSAEKQAALIDQPETEPETGLGSAHLQTGAEELKNAPPELKEVPQPETAVLDQIASNVPRQIDKSEVSEMPLAEKQAPPFIRPASEFQMNLEPSDTENVIHRLFGREPLISSPSEIKEPLAEGSAIDQTISNVPEQTDKDIEAGELFKNEKQAPLIDQPERESEVRFKPTNSQTNVNSSKEGAGLEGLSSLTKEKSHTEIHDFEESVTSGQDQINETDKLSQSPEINDKDEISESPEAVEKIPALEQNGSSEKPVELSQQTQVIESPADFQEPIIVVLSPTQQTTSYTRGPDPDNPSLCMAFEELEGDAPCIFITGRVGTGKNILLDYFIKTTSKNVVVLASTGIDALNIESQTIYSFFNFHYGIINENEVQEIPDPAQQELYRHIDTIIVDETSMVNANLVDAMDLFMRLNGRESDKPFGGTQVILFGDLFQPAPDMTKKEISDLLTKNYRSRFFFDAHVFQQLPMKMIELQKDYYHCDETLAALLNSIRMNSLDDAQIKLLACRYDPNFITPIDKSYVTLTSNNNIAAQINKDHLRQLPLPECIHIAEIEGDFEEHGYPADKELILRRGAQVVLLTDDRAKRWVRGTLGKVTSMSECTVQVEIDQDGSPFIFRIERENWQNYRYKLDTSTGKIEKELMGEFTQYPLSLAWAVSVNKSQGYRFDNAVIDLTGDEDEHGQIYAALSSCKSLDGIVLKDEIWRTDSLYEENRILEIARHFS